MDEEALFKVLKRQTKATLLELLHSAYYETNTQQRRYIFGELMKKSKPSKVIAKDVIKESEKFYEDSLAGLYYAPFEINSKNFAHIPEKTEEWFEKRLRSFTFLYTVNETGRTFIGCQIFSNSL